MNAYVLALAVVCLAFQSAVGGRIKGVTMCESGRISSNFCEIRTSMDTCFAEPKLANFTLPFLEEPAVMVGLAKLNAGNVDNTRVNTKYEATTESLTVYFICMLKSHCYAASVNWMACGMVNKRALNKMRKDE